MKNATEDKSTNVKYFSMRINPSLNERLEATSKEEHRDKSAIVHDAIAFYLVQSEGQKRFEILANHTAMANQQQVNDAIEELKLWIEGARSMFDWVEEAKEAFASTAENLGREVGREIGREVLQLRSENRRLQALVEEVLERMAGGSQVNPASGQVQSSYTQGNHSGSNHPLGKPYQIPGSSE